MLQGYVIEGVSGAGKTRLLGELQLQLASRCPGSTRLVLSEHYTDRVVEDARARGELGLPRTLEHTRTIVGHVQDLFRLKAHSKFREKGGNASIQVLIERFLGGHVASLSARSEEPLEFAPAQWRELERQYACLAELRLLPVVLTLPVPRIGPAITATRAHRNAAWSEHLDSLGGEEDITEHFVTWQERLLWFYQRLDTPWRRVEVQGGDDPAVVRALASDLVDALELTGWDQGGGRADQLGACVRGPEPSPRCCEWGSDTLFDLFHDPAQRFRISAENEGGASVRPPLRNPAP